ncbi:MAG: hypothetical protein PHR77_06760 [Kiritimatiellae bacterium]|nr:hypothetical protein [Kiritimatiellia bacterium]MDD5521961.1 hypothetical protein [Kiritimatiellia bacterium]
MKAKNVLIVAVLFLVFSVSSYATDKNAKFIDSIGVIGMSYGDGQLLDFQLWGETALGGKNSSKEWALIVGGGIGTDSPDNSDDIDIWNGLAGIKYYFNDLTSLALIGSYMAYDTDANNDITSASLVGKHRFVEVSEGVSPFLTASGIFRSIDTGSGENDSEIVATVGLGCEFLLTDDLSIVFEASYLHGEAIDSGGYELQDGVVAAIYFTGYWD